MIDNSSVLLGHLLTSAKRSTGYQLTPRSLFTHSLYYDSLRSSRTLIRSFASGDIRSLIHSFTHSLIRYTRLASLVSHAHSLIRSFIHSFTHFNFIPVVLFSLVSKCPKSTLLQRLTTV